MHYDVIVIGGGPGGTAAAKHLAKGGKNVALIAPELGGECLNYGCIPTKTYVWTADLLDKIKEAGTIGIDVTGAQLNWQRLQERKTEVIAKLKKGLAFSLQREKVTIIEGWAEFIDAHTIKVGADEITADYFIIAAGSGAAAIPGFEWSDKIRNNRTILELPHVPSSLLVIGGGAIGVEFASIFAGFGTQVTIAEAQDRLLTMEDPDISAELTRVFARKNITVKTNTRMSVADTNGYEYVLVAVGRTPTLSGLNVEKIGLTTTARAITTNEVMQTNVSHIYAIGDIAGKALLAYSAEYEGRVAADTIMGRTVQPVQYDAIPSTIFSMPEIASVGKNEAQLKAAGTSYIVGKSAYSANAKALIMGARDGFAKVIAAEKTKQILGVHIIGEKATELISQATLAFTHHMTIEQFFSSIQSHPVVSEVLKEAAEAIC